MVQARGRRRRPEGQAEPEWFSRVWLGPANSGSETLIRTTEGVVKASAIKRLDVNAILEMKRTPQRPDPTKPGLHIPVQKRMGPEVPFSMPAMKPARGEEGPRRPHIMKRRFEDFWYTEECEGCARFSTGMKRTLTVASADRECTTRPTRRKREGSGWKKQKQESASS